MGGRRTALLLRLGLYTPPSSQTASSGRFVGGRPQTPAQVQQVPPARIPLAPPRSAVLPMYGQFPFPFVICPTESRNLLSSARQITTTHPVSSNLTPSPFSFPGAKKGLPEGSLWEIVISLSCEQNSARKFQSGVSNSGFQIPKHARQNSEVTENSCFTLQKPVERPQNSSRRFLDSCFCFRVPFRGWNLGRFPFPISRFSVQIQGR